MSTPLIDPQGFPRSDIDVAQSKVHIYDKANFVVRTVRAQVIRLRNDHKDVMLRIEKGLHALHQENRNTVEAQPTPTAPTTVAPQLIPFAIVNSVAVSSPAADAVSHHYGSLTDDRVF
jgi:26S proteasome regulatory subunit N4